MGESTLIADMMREEKVLSEAEVSVGERGSDIVAETAVRDVALFENRFTNLQKALDEISDTDLEEFLSCGTLAERLRLQRYTRLRELIKTGKRLQREHKVKMAEYKRLGKKISSDEVASAEMRRSELSALKREYERIKKTTRKECYGRRELGSMLSGGISAYEFEWIEVVTHNLDKDYAWCIAQVWPELNAVSRKIKFRELMLKRAIVAELEQRTIILRNRSEYEENDVIEILMGVARDAQLSGRNAGARVAAAKLLGLHIGMFSRSSSRMSNIEEGNGKLQPMGNTYNVINYSDVNDTPVELGLLVSDNIDTIIESVDKMKSVEKEKEAVDG
jgi:hypothetical protein